MNPIARLLSTLLLLLGTSALYTSAEASTPPPDTAEQPAARLAAAQPPYAEPLDEVLDRVSHHFGVRMVCKRFRADTLTVRWAAYRLRPYSLAESLDNLLKPLDLVWKENKNRIEIQPYEYYRRTPADGERLLAWLSEQYTTQAEWEARRAQLLVEARAAVALESFLQAMAEKPTEIVGAEHRHKGYTTRNFALETLPGLYVCGTIYAPQTSSRRPKPLIVAPSGHWPEGRYRADHQHLMASLARMGAVAVDMDIFGWGESEQQIGIEAHTADYAMQMQVLWSLRVTDWILRTRKDIDPERVAATGGSGGATHALLLALMDGRFTALAPVVHLVSHFDGGCPCESGRPVTLAGGGSCTPELLAAVMAPKPVLTVSDGGDWTATYPTLEFPYLQRIWGFYGAGDAVRNTHFADERHDLGASKRRAVYAFFAEVFGLPLSAVNEDLTEVVAPEALQIFAERPWPTNAIRGAKGLRFE